ncbi:hypothetical protein D3C87_1978700 [compost metagenome]
MTPLSGSTTPVTDIEIGLPAGAPPWATSSAIAVAKASKSSRGVGTLPMGVTAFGPVAVAALMVVPPISKQVIIMLALPAGI